LSIGKFLFLFQFFTNKIAHFPLVSHYLFIMFILTFINLENCFFLENQRDHEVYREDF
jgi:hypothetical protein